MPDITKITTEAMAAFCIACILTLVFISPLHGILVISLCSFSIALPLFVLIRVMGEKEEGVPDFPARNPFVFACLSAISGWIELLWGIYWGASVSFVAGVAISFILVWRWQKSSKH